MFFCIKLLMCWVFLRCFFCSGPVVLYIFQFVLHGPGPRDGCIQRIFPTHFFSIPKRWPVNPPRPSTSERLDVLHLNHHCLPLRAFHLGTSGAGLLYPPSRMPTCQRLCSSFSFTPRTPGLPFRNVCGMGST